MLGNMNEFPVGQGANAQTREVDSKFKQFLGDPKEIKLCLVDTQGLCDPDGDEKDIENIREMVQTIRRLQKVDLFLYCAEEVNPRFTPYIQETVSLFDAIFPDFLEHMALVFNKSSTKNIKNRDKLTNQWNDKFKRDFELPLDRELPTFFFDSNVPASEQMSYDDQASKFKEYLINKKTSCDVVFIEPKPTARVALKEELERLKKDLEEKRKELEASEKLRIDEKKKADKFKKNLMIAGGSSGGTAAVGIVLLLIIFI